MHWSQRGPITPDLQLKLMGRGKGREGERGREREERGRAGVKKERRERQGKELKQQKDHMVSGSYNTLFLITGGISNIEYG